MNLNLILTENLATQQKKHFLTWNYENSSESCNSWKRGIYLSINNENSSTISKNNLRIRLNAQQCNNIMTCLTSHNTCSHLQTRMYYFTSKPRVLNTRHKNSILKSHVRITWKDMLKSIYVYNKRWMKKEE